MTLYILKQSKKNFPFPGRCFEISLLVNCIVFYILCMNRGSQVGEVTCYRLGDQKFDSWEEQGKYNFEWQLLTLWKGHIVGDCARPWWKKLRKLKKSLRYVISGPYSTRILWFTNHNHNLCINCVKIHTEVFLLWHRVVCLLKMEAACSSAALAYICQAPQRYKLQLTAQVTTCKIFFSLHFCVIDPHLLTYIRLTILCHVIADGMI
jgi:hypothetical protein